MTDRVLLTAAQKRALRCLGSPRMTRMPARATPPNPLRAAYGGAA